MQWIGIILGVGALAVLAILIMRWMDSRQANATQQNAALLAQAEAERAKAAAAQERSRNSPAGITRGVLDAITAAL